MKTTERIWFSLAEVALFFNALVLLSVTMDLEWVRSRAAGGQFEEFPIGIRATYLLMAIGMLYLMRFLRTLYRAERDLSKRERSAAKWLGILFLVSTVTQLISRSPDERWNAIPAVIIATAFLRVYRATAARFSAEEN